MFLYFFFLCSYSIKGKEEQRKGWQWSAIQGYGWANRKNNENRHGRRSMRATILKIWAFISHVLLLRSVLKSDMPTGKL